MLIKRFGFAKITENKDLNTPALLKVGDHVKFDDDGCFEFLGKKIERSVLYTPEVKQSEIKISENIYLIPNILTMLKNTKQFVDYTVHLRDKLGYDKLFYAPGAPPNMFPILTYLGYDIFDNSLEMLEEYSLLGETYEGIKDFSNIMIQQTRIAIQSGKIRELVESIPDNKTKEILRYLDLKYYETQENFYPIWNRTLDAVSSDSLSRPDIKRWIQRLKDRYKKPTWAKDLLLLPCSAKKPYSLSKSHREFKRHIKSTMHEVILTSPIALVPRELERFYPAQNYDIAVVGHWYEDEKKLIKETLRWFLETFHYENIVSFLPENMRFLEDLLKEFDTLIIWDRDFEKLEKVTKEIDHHVSRKKIEIENFKTLAKFQFNACEDLLEGSVVKGRYQQINIWKGGKRIFGYNPEKGMLTLTQESAKCILENGKYIVHIDDFYPEGDVFVAGILNASSEIREGDEVAVAYENELRGWGIARMGYVDLLQQKKGKGVKLRGKIKH